MASFPGDLRTLNGNALYFRVVLRGRGGAFDLAFLRASDVSESQSGCFDFSYDSMLGLSLLSAFGLFFMNPFLKALYCTISGASRRCWDNSCRA